MWEGVFWTLVGGWLVVVVLFLWAIERRLAEINGNCRTSSVVPPEEGFLDIGTTRPK